MTTILVSGDGELLDPAAPTLYADDFGVLRGDGVFETLLVRDGRARGVARHLARLADSASILDLPEPDPAALSRAIRVAEAEWAARSDGEGMLRVVFTRGRESGGAPTAYVSVHGVGARVARARAAGVSAITLARGYRPGTAADAPWQLAGAKVLSYASNIAALRYAASRGVDDAIYLADDGAVLEGPRSSVVAAVDGGLLTPPRDDGILPGTTQAAVFDVAAQRGISAREAVLTVDDLRAADGVWLLSSVTLAARVHTLDGQALASSSTVDVPALVTESLAGK
ncbi:MAG: aminodeoxychorismate lyase [Gordonia sp. (in: high G+C Gram-positive bacteria)]